MSKDRLTAVVAGAALAFALLALARTAPRTVPPDQIEGNEGNSGGMQTEHHSDEARAIAERVTVGLSAGLILLVAGLVVYSHLLAGSEPASIQVNPVFEELREEAGSYYLPVGIENTGDRTAQDVRVEVSIPSATAGREIAEISVQFLAGGETIEAVAVFQHAPTQQDLSTNIVSYLRAD